MKIVLIFAILVIGSCSTKPYQPVLHYLKNAEFIRNIYCINQDCNNMVYISEKQGVFYIKQYNLKDDSSQILLQSNGNIASVRLYKNIIYYTHDRSGNGDYTMYEYDRDTKITKLILGSQTTSIRIVTFSDKNIFYLENTIEKQKQYFYKYNLETQQKILIKKPAANRDVAMFMESDDIIIECENLGHLKYKLYSYNIKAKKEKLLTPVAANYKPFSYDSKTKNMYLSSDFEGEFLQGYKINIKTGKITKLISENSDVMQIGYNKKYWFYKIESFGKITTKIFTDEFKIFLMQIDDGNIIGFDKYENTALLSISSETKPRKFALLNLMNKQYTDIDIIKNKNYLPIFIKPELLKYKSRDGYDIYGYLFMPITKKPKNGYPLLMAVHGGPTSHFVSYARLDYQSLLTNGYAIFAPDFRGSTGYGKRFINLANVNGIPDHSKTPLFDVIDGKNYILQNYAKIDQNRVGIMGGSWGGYMALAALAFEPYEFKVGIEINGPTDLVDMVNSPDAMRNNGMLDSYEQIGNPNINLGDMYDRSPFLYADKIKSPLLMIHGKDDWRFEDSMHLIQNAVIKNGGYADLIIYDNEGHSLVKNSNTSPDYNKKILTFLKKFL